MSKTKLMSFARRFSRNPSPGAIELKGQETLPSNLASFDVKLIANSSDLDLDLAD